MLVCPTVNKNEQPRRFQVHYGQSSRHPGDKGYVITDAGEPPVAAAVDGPRVFTSDSKSETIARAETMNAGVEQRDYSLPNAIECAAAELGTPQTRIVSFLVDVPLGRDGDYDFVREQIGSGVADLISDEAYDPS